MNACRKSNGGRNKYIAGYSLQTAHAGVPARQSCQAGVARFLAKQLEPDMKPATPVKVASPPTPVAEIAIGPLPLAAEPGPETETLMPFGAAAKAIFVKANGLPAYRKSIRFARRAD